MYHFRMAEDMDDVLELSIMSNDDDVEVPALDGSFMEIQETEHQCAICNNTYSTKYNLQRHISVHSGSAHCTKCSNVFDNEDLLKEHVSQKHDKHCFMCEDCGSDFMTKQSLRRHRIVKHNIEHDCSTISSID